MRGQGLIAGVELVHDRATRDPAGSHAARVIYRAFELGLVLIYTGPHGNVLELTPPLTVSEADIDAALSMLERALADVAGGRFDDAKLANYAGW